MRVLQLGYRVSWVMGSRWIREPWFLPMVEDNMSTWVPTGRLVAPLASRSGYTSISMLIMRGFSTLETERMQTIFWLARMGPTIVSLLTSKTPLPEMWGIPRMDRHCFSSGFMQSLPLTMVPMGKLVCESIKMDLISDNPEPISHLPLVRFEPRPISVVPTGIMIPTSRGKWTISGFMWVS